MNAVCVSIQKFLLTRPSRDVTPTVTQVTVTGAISTHTSLAGRDPEDPDGPGGLQISTHTSLAGRDLNNAIQQALGDNISTHTSLAGRDYLRGFLTDISVISTHTSLAGRDPENYITYEAPKKISTHTSLAGRDTAVNADRLSGGIFLLTRPSRDVTGTLQLEEIWGMISTHTSLAGRDRYILYKQAATHHTSRDGQIQYVHYINLRHVFHPFFSANLPFFWPSHILRLHHHTMITPSGL